jgi:hypothetical protein
MARPKEYTCYRGIERAKFSANVDVEVLMPKAYDEYSA